MIIESVALEGVRHFRDRIVLDGLKPGLNIIVAPNGMGKSTIIDGLVTSLVQNHKTAGDKLGALLRHVNYDLTSSVEVTFSRRDGRYRLKKSFLKNPLAKLERFESGQFRAIADGEDVELWLQAALALDRPGAGVAKPEHYGLGAILWARQSEPSLSKLPGSPEQQLRSLISPSSTASSPIELSIRESLTDEFRQYWAPTGRAYATGKDKINVPALLSSVDAAKAREEEAALVVQDLSITRQKFDETSTRHDIRLKRRSEQRLRLDELKVDADKVRALESDIALAVQASQAASADLMRLSKERDSFNTAKAQLAMLEPELVSIDNTLELLGKELREVEAAETRAFEEQMRANAAFADVISEETAIADAQTFLLTNSKFSEETSRLANIAELCTARDVKLHEIAGIIAPDDDLWKKITKAQKALKEAQQRVESESLTLRFTPEHDMDFRVVLGSTEGPRRAIAGVESVVTGLGALEIQIAGVGSLSVSSQMASAAKLQNALDSAREVMHSLMLPFGETSTEVLENRRAQRASIEWELADFASRLSALLGTDVIEDVAKKVEELRAKRAELVLRYPDWDREEPNPDAMQQKIEPRREAAVLAAKEATIIFESKVSKRKDLGKRRDAESAAREVKMSQVVRHRETVKKAETTDLPGQIDEVGQRDLLASARLQMLRSERATISGDPIGEYESVVTSVERLSNEINDDAIAKTELRVKLDSSSGAYDTLAKERANLETATRQYRIAEGRAKQLKLLNDELEKATKLVADAVNVPLAERATSYARRIMSREDARVGLSIDEKGVIRLAYGLSQWGGKMISETISGGEQEQLEIAMRLAMGSLLAQNEPQVVILDDALTYCDPVRLYRILEVLADVENCGLQVILTGCDSDRYASMPASANLMNLESLLRRPAAA